MIQRLCQHFQLKGSKRKLLATLSTKKFLSLEIKGFEGAHRAHAKEVPELI